jgi:hypothetical protein
VVVGRSGPSRPLHQRAVTWGYTLGLSSFKKNVIQNAGSSCGCRMLSTCSTDDLYIPSALSVGLALHNG